MRSVHRLLLVLACGLPLAADAQDFEAERRALVREIRNDVAQTSFYIGRSKLDERVMQALATVPRHRFVPDHLQRYAYDNRPLPIGHGQTISQPFIVALMTDLLEPAADAVALEIGTGSGYQAAVLAGLVKEVHSIEIVAPLGESARARLAALGYDNVQTRIGDGYYGWAEHAPYDAIIVTAAASHIPPPLVRQLKPGGVLVIPVGTQFQVQQLTLVRKAMDGTVSTRQVLPVRFVPLTGGH